MQILLYVIADFPVLKAALAASTLRPLSLKAVEAGLLTDCLVERPRQEAGAAEMGVGPRCTVDTVCGLPPISVTIDMETGTRAKGLVAAVVSTSTRRQLTEELWKEL